MNDTTLSSSVADDVRRRAEQVMEQMEEQSSAKRRSAVAGADSAAGASGERFLSRCLVFCRLRPTNKIDSQNGGSNIVALQGKRVIVKDERHYDYDGTFGPDSTQDEIFTSVAIPCIEHAFKGFCSALMCYGQTGTGKSFTMCNTDPAQQGIIPRASRYIFDFARSEATRTGRAFTVTGQFVQIYRDHLGDLMSTDGKTRVEIYYEPDKGVSFPGCSSHQLTDAESFMQFYTEGNARRVVTATAMNPESSRGHTAMMVWVTSEDPEDPMQGNMRGKITFIDLAGYERFSKTGITSSNPIMKDEAKTINASLLALGHVVSSLSSGSKHIPWRDSKLTRILQDSIGGRSRTSIVLTIGPSSDHLYETTNTLQFGQRAMAVKVEAKASVTVDYVKLAKKLMLLLDEKDEKINVLELQVASRDAEREELLERYQREQQDLEARFKSDLDHLQSTGANEEQIQKLREVYNAEVQNLQEQQTEEINYQDEHHSKEITKLINEQKHVEAKNIAEMKIAQERLMEDFQRKLDSARGGTNADLLKALQQLAEKDTILASRANDTARLHRRIEVLAERVTTLGGDPSVGEDEPITASFLDVSQVEEIQNRYTTELERQHNKQVELRAQLDRMSVLCHARMEEVTRLLAEKETIAEKLQLAGVDVSDDLDLVRAKREALIDPSELESLRLSLQADVDEARSERDTAITERDTLQKKLIESEQQLRKAGTASLANSMYSKPGAIELDDWESGTPSESGNHGPHSKPRNGRQVITGVAAYKKMIERLTSQLATSTREKNVLYAKLQAQRERAGESGLPSPDTPSLPASTPLEPPAVGHGPESGDAAAAAGRLSDWASGANSGTPEEAAELIEALSATHPRAALILSLELIERQTLEQLVAQQETALTEERAEHQRDREYIEVLRKQLEDSGITPEECAPTLQPIESLSLDDYMTLVRQLRSTNRALCLELASSAHGGEKSPDADEDTTAEHMLKERDDQLELKDEMLLEKGAMSQYLARLSSRLISQMKTLGLEPCGVLPQSYETLLEDENEQLDIQTEKQRELEERLAQEQEEKAKMDRLLKALNAEREYQSAVLTEAEAKTREMEEREARTVQTIHRLATEKTQREKVLEEAARRATRELMEAQARLASKESEKKSSVFERFLGRLMD